MNFFLAFLRRLRTRLKLTWKSHFLTYGKDIHIGKNVRLWAPNHIILGNHVYLGAHVHIECNCTLGDFALIANNVAFVGRHDHEFSTVGTPIRYSPCIRGNNFTHEKEEVIIGKDVWIGYGAIILTGIKIGNGAIIASGSVVTSDIPQYSIAAGVPAKVIGQRFNQTDALEHEARIARGEFSLSEKGFNYCKIRPFAEPLSPEQISEVVNNQTNITKQ